MQPLFSILMCTYNSSKTLESSICSVMNQRYKLWELVILDNGSSDLTVDMLRQYEAIDSRIRIECGEKNIGWCKGISECLKRANGKYMMFLGADDYLPNNAVLEEIACEVEKHNPDIVFTGAKAIYYENEQCNAQVDILPSYRVWTDENVAEKLASLMDEVYYNSVMHYVRIDFLKDIGVDFFSPFYGDCQGITEVICKAKKMVVLDKISYVLAIHTSQTSGAVIYDYDFSRQWRSIRDAIGEISGQNYSIVCHIAERVATNLTTMCEHILLGGKVRNQLMIDMKVGLPERFCLIEKWLDCDIFMELISFSKRQIYEEKVVGTAGVLYWECKKNKNISDEIKRRSRWLADLVEEIMIRDSDGVLQWKNAYEEDEFHQIIMNYRTGEKLC